MSLLQKNNNAVNVYNNYVNHDWLVNENAKRKKQGKKSIGFQNFIGYLTQEVKHINNYQSFNNDNDEALEIKSNSYLFRESVINKKYNQFEWKTEDNVIGFYNNEFLTVENFNQKVKPLYKRLEKESDNLDANVQLGLISIDPKYNNLLSGNLDVKEFYTVVNNNFRNLARDYGYNPDNLDYLLVCHTDKEHIHIHLPFVEKVKERKRGKLDLDFNETFKENINTWLNAKANNRDYIKVVLDKNLIDKITSEVQMSKDLYERLANCPNKNVGNIKDKQLKQELYDYVDTILEQSGQLEEIEIVHQKRLLRKQNDDNYSDKDVDKLKQDDIDRLRKDTANYIYKNIEKVNKDIQYNENDVRKKNNYTNYKVNDEDYNNFNKDMNIKKMKYLMFYTKNNDFIWNQFKYNFKKGMRDYDKDKKAVKQI